MKALALNSLLIKSGSFFIMLLISTVLQAQVTEDNAVDFESQTIQMALSGEPRQLDHMKTTDAISFFIIEHTQEGLLRRDASSNLVEGVAESWSMDNEIVRFKLRQDARWSNGDIVTAHDFVFAWRRVVNPETASEYASIMYPVKNAEAISNGELPITRLGITALDDFTLEIELENPTGYFLKLMPFGLFYPAQEKFVSEQNGRYGADVENLLFNGPFTMTTWVHGASIRMEKNYNYWNKDSINLEAINIPYITPDSPARFNLYKDNKIAIENAILGLESEQLQSSLDSRYRVRSASDGSLFFVQFNYRSDRITNNKNFRQALQLVFDSQELVNKVIGIAGFIPGKSLFPVYLDGVDNKFRQEYDTKNVALNIEKAVEHLILAKAELGLDEIPPLVLLTDDRPISSLMSQYLQSYLKQTLDIDVLIDIQTFKLRLTKSYEGKFDMVISGWSPDYEDPMTFADHFASWNANNSGRYNNPQYDELVRLAQTASDAKVRMDAMGAIQDLVIDEVVMLPLYERIVNYVQNPKLRGVRIQMTGGSPVLTHARVIE